MATHVSDIDVALACSFEIAAAFLEGFAKPAVFFILADHARSRSPAAPCFSVDFRKDETTLRLFTAVATLGTPQDVTLQELRIESFFPMDSDTTKVMRTWAVGERATKA